MAMRVKKTNDGQWTVNLGKRLENDLQELKLNRWRQNSNDRKEWACHKGCQILR
jgi:GTP cyclohydrolase III